MVLAPQFRDKFWVKGWETGTLEVSHVVWPPHSKHTQNGRRHMLRFVGKCVARGRVEHDTIHKKHDRITAQHNQGTSQVWYIGI